jgi:hypothetical protein
MPREPPNSRQFKERTTPPLSELLRTRREGMLEVVNTLRKDLHHVDPLPPSLEQLIEDEAARSQGGGPPVAITSNPLGSEWKGRV